VHSAYVFMTLPYGSVLMWQLYRSFSLVTTNVQNSSLDTESMTA